VVRVPKGQTGGLVQDDVFHFHVFKSNVPYPAGAKPIDVPFGLEGIRA
jgi:hypothetical protein